MPFTPEIAGDRLPEPAILAESFFREAARHLADARTLHRNGRFAGAVGAAQKASELALKSLYILDDGLGWFKMFDTHTPFKDVLPQDVDPAKWTPGKEKPVFHLRIIGRLLEEDPTLRSNLHTLESYSTGGTFSGSADSVNAEYPFVFRPSADGAPGVLTLCRPEEFFDAGKSTESYQTALRLLGACRRINRTVRTWNVRLPRRL